MKVYISADMEGISGVVNNEHTDRNGREHDRARIWMTEEVNAAIEGALDAGATEIIVNDSHGTMRNIILESLNPAAKLITGSPKRYSMVECLDETFDAAIFIGYHARAGSSGVLCHTYTDSVEYVKIDEKEVGETGINGGVAGYYGVPLILVSGDDVLCNEAKALIPGIYTVEVKKALSRNAALCLSLNSAHSLIRTTVKEALFHKDNIKPLTFNKPVLLEVRFTNPAYADAASTIPGVKRIDSKTLTYMCDDYLIAFDAFRSMINIES
ncbi:M55 family metallopeptidase [Calorimonas adulescens]|jgi:D-aminopeptidase.|uniref:M55 family metallopeptidase n=1 Tax=Calorimonas adulescens TaxID=2606906 RepID=A0A5D8QH24_9THEO|nr:M55 family metallopeptidase [Calorimonas adulescens]TZE83597.1 M55 family metallopeptidase [Calorimonas adulescens]